MPESQLWAPTPPICLTWEVMQGPGQVGDAGLGLGFRVAAELSGMGMEDGWEAVVFPGHPGRKGGTFIEAATQPILPASVLGELPAPPTTRAIPEQVGDSVCSGHVNLEWWKVRQAR